MKLFKNLVIPIATAVAVLLSVGKLVAQQSIVSSFTAPLSIILGGTGQTSIQGFVDAYSLATESYVQTESRQISTETKTTNYAVAYGDNGLYFNNSGATGEVDFSLPSTTSTPLRYCFSVLSGQILKIIVPDNSTLNVGSIQSSTGGYMQSNQLYSSTCLYSPSTSIWLSESTPVGTWSIN